MTIHWELLVAVFVVSLASVVAVVALVALALVGLSARVGPRHAPFSPRAGSVVAGTCSAAAAVIVLFGLWKIVGG